MEQKAITNEAIRKKFVNQFELVGRAISLAENMIQSGRGPRVKMVGYQTYNPTNVVIAEMSAGVDIIDPIEIKKEVVAEFNTATSFKDDEPVFEKKPKKKIKL